MTRYDPNAFFIPPLPKLRTRYASDNLRLVAFPFAWVRTTNRKDIFELLDAPDFEPFRIHLADGRTFDVTHPDSAFVSPTRLTLIKTGPESSHHAERIDYFGLLHVVRIEPLRQAA